LHERNDRKFAHVSVLFAHMAKINNIDLKNSEQTAGSTYIADHLEWAQFHSYNQLRTEIKDKFQQLISPLSSDVDKAEVYIAARFAIAMLTHDYSTFKNSIDKEIHKKWALNAIHTGHKEWLVSEIEQAVEHEDFLFSNDHLCYAHSPHDSNEFKYAHISVLISNLANDGGEIKEGESRVKELADWNFHVAWARFRSVKEMRQSLLNKMSQMIYNFPSSNSIASAYRETVKTILELSQNSSYKEEDFSKDYGWVKSPSSNGEQEIIKQISNLLSSDDFLSPVGQKSSK
jgi:hypothetical protein